MSQQYLKRYFSERDLPDRLIEVEANGITHLIWSKEVERLVCEVAGRAEQSMVAEKIRQIEFHNPNAIHGFIDHLAKCFCEQNC